MAALPPNGPRPSAHLKEPAVVHVMPKAIRPVTAPISHHKKNESTFSPIDYDVTTTRCHICALNVFGQPFTEISNNAFSQEKFPICSPVCFQRYIKDSTVKIQTTSVLKTPSNSPKRPCNIPPPPAKPIPPLNLTNAKK